MFKLKISLLGRPEILFKMNSVFLSINELNYWFFLSKAIKLLEAKKFYFVSLKIVLAQTEPQHLWLTKRRPRHLS